MDLKREYKLPKAKTKLDELFDVMKSQEELEYWYAHYTCYPYRSLNPIRIDLYSNVLSMVNTSLESKWLNPEQLHEEYGFSKSWQAKARMSDSKYKLPFYKIAGKFIKYKRSEIEEWIESHKMR
ncbi:hypothetical protein GA417_01685 [Poseidonibacter ostreae]|uniref:helix-turn-helix transcriptional regulator n=1 Tax=Poseidonibacter ostreae TaxID=2654171 RepID=UPI0012643F09|nr:hypothetical protein [Poseidonibacter ostreae]KAB7887677.1 hypothetical protein GA417_01685 [Poseidonibacter ostreae]